jgi:hypothetical protein
MGEIKEYKGLTGKQVLVNVPNGYRFVQNGLKVELVRKSRDKWEDKDSGVNGFFVNGLHLAQLNDKYNTYPDLHLSNLAPSLH